jgi:hypothetical protein
MRTLSAALVGALAVTGGLLALPQSARAQYYGVDPYQYDYDYVQVQPYYGADPYGYVPARRYYDSYRRYSNQRYGTYWDERRGSPATLGYCQRHPYRCR